MPIPRVRLDTLLTARGYFENPAAAVAAVMEGRVTVNSTVCDKPGTLVRESAEIGVRGASCKYASRGGLKLEAALQAFQLDVSGRVVLDAGASAGGFTDCLIQHGAARVYSVDVGYGQLRGRLAAHPRVVNRERTNISDVTLASLDPPIDLCVFDLSYLSIALALPILVRLFSGPPDIIGLIKPLFEQVDRAAMQEPGALRAALDRVSDIAHKTGLIMTQVAPSPILGSNGAVEFLGRFQPDAVGATPPPPEELDAAVALAANLCRAVSQPSQSG